VSAEATGFQRDLYEFRELPSPLSQFLEKEFFNYADRTAADALKMLLDGLPKHLWSSETLSAWARFLIGVHTRHFDTIPEIRDAAKSLWVASGEQSQRIYEDSREPGDPATFDDWIALRDPLIPHKAKDRQIVDRINADHLGRARRFVWATSQSHSQATFIRAHMSTKLEKPPFFPSLANYPAPSSGAATAATPAGD
jgi:hypothetical protein